MFDSLGSFGLLFAAMLLLTLGSVGVGLLIKNARERRYLALAEPVRLSVDTERSTYVR